jgi:hypothetical protein
MPPTVCCCKLEVIIVATLKNIGKSEIFNFSLTNSRWRISKLPRVLHKSGSIRYTRLLNFIIYPL